MARVLQVWPLLAEPGVEWESPTPFLPQGLLPPVSVLLFLVPVSALLFRVPVLALPTLRLSGSEQLGLGCLVEPRPLLPVWEWAALSLASLAWAVRHLQEPRPYPENPPPT